MERLPLGFINIYKPAGPTSTAIGSIIRRELREQMRPADRKRLGVGHFGTLDPAATGVLPLAVGNATRVLPYIRDTDKTYKFTLVLGTQTHTGDADGTVVATQAIPQHWAAALPDVLAEFRGPGMQIPPMVSALRVDGKRLYEIARSGETVERLPRAISLHELTLLAVDAQAHTAQIRTVCSAGTYIRSLCEDLARRLGTCGHMRDLVRERAGPFGCDTALTVDAVREQGLQALIDPRAVVPLADLALDADGVRDFQFGRSIHWPDHGSIVRGSVEDGALLFLSELAGAVAERAGQGGFAGDLLGIGEVSGLILRPKVVFA